VGGALAPVDEEKDMTVRPGDGGYNGENRGGAVRLTGGEREDDKGRGVDKLLPRQPLNRGATVIPDFASKTRYSSHVYPGSCFLHT
jgi:hypothetical protein